MVETSFEGRGFPVAERFLRAFTGVARAPSLADKVTEQLTHAITSGNIRPGERLPSERDLGEQFQVSRTVVREAVRSLAARGLVRVTSGRGVEICRSDPKQVAASMRLLIRGREGLDYGHVNEVRMALEVQMAGLAAKRANDADIARLADICNHHQRELAAGDLAAASELDYQFHRELTRASGNDLMLAILDSISDVLREVRLQSMHQPHVGEDGLQAHRRILKAVRSRSVGAARAAMVDHLAEAERIWRGGGKAARPTSPGKNAHKRRSRS